jgi:hypothetical protein
MRALALNRQLVKLSLYKWFARTLVSANTPPLLKRERARG